LASTRTCIQRSHLKTGPRILLDEIDFGLQ
jgi:hypothetical protein